MSAEVPIHQEYTQIDVASEVRLLRLHMGVRLPLAKLGQMTNPKTAASHLCRWENGYEALRPAVVRQVRQAVRKEFAKFVVEVAQLAAQHNIEV